MLQRWSETFSQWLVSPRQPVHLAVVAIVLTLPALWVGWQLDDHFQRVMLLGEADPTISPFQIFSLLGGDPEVTLEFVDLGSLPWWTPEDFRLSFFRYLSVATMWLDYRLWPESAWLMHLHSLLWFGGLVAAAGMLFRQIMGSTTAAGLAALLYAVDEAHAGPAGWLANRNALLATLFGLLCLLAHDRWRRSGWRPGASLGPLCLALGLASGETALATVGYLAAHAVFLDRGGPVRRCLALLPNALVLVGWGIVYRAWGFGAQGSGMYVDPVASPVAYLEAFADRAPFLLLGQWSPVPADAGSFLEGEAVRWLWWIALGVTASVAAILLPRLRRDRFAGFWCTGMLLALVPASATFPSNRLLFFVGLGAMGLLARFLTSVFSETTDVSATSAGRMLARGLAIAMIATHLVLSPLAMPVGAYSARIFGDSITTAVATLPRDPAIARQDLVVVHAPDFLMYVAHIPTIRSLEGLPLPRRLRGLAAAPVSLVLHRPDERTLEVRAAEQDLFAGPLGWLFRSPDRPMEVGTRVELTGVTAEVLAATERGAPVAARFRFAVPLEDPSLRWVTWRDGRYVAFHPPAVGRTSELPRATGAFDLTPARVVSD